jgi:hypothetical protein
MNQHNRCTWLCGAGDFALAADAPPLPPFARPVLDFLEALSFSLLGSKALREYPDIAAFAFFCRRGNLEQLRKEYTPDAPKGQGDGPQAHRIGRGMAFHIAPGNVPLNFAYSLAAALLAGNSSVVKASSRDFPQTRLICEAMAALLDPPASPHHPLLPYVNVIAYPRELQELTQELSALCDLRIIWGGDETVARIRQAPLSPRAFDVTFADRYSLLVLRASALPDMDKKQLEAVAQGFYNDTFLTDQNACTSPRLLYWLADPGDAPSWEQTRAAQDRFWEAVRRYAAPRYPLQSVVAVDKLTAFYEAAIRLPGVYRPDNPDNLITRIGVRELTPQVESIRCPGGCFVEYVDTDLKALVPVVSPKFQTLTYLGLDPLELRRFVLSHGLRGIDRIVPLGHSMDFSLTWDGYDLIRTLSRQVEAR